MNHTDVGRDGRTCLARSNSTGTSPTTLTVALSHPYCVSMLNMGVRCKGGVCLVGEKPDKELPGIVAARGDTLSWMMCVVNFVFAFLTAPECSVGMAWLAS